VTGFKVKSLALGNLFPEVTTRYESLLRKDPLKEKLDASLDYLELESSMKFFSHQADSMENVALHLDRSRKVREFNLLDEIEYCLLIMTT